MPRAINSDAFCAIVGRVVHNWPAMDYVRRLATGGSDTEDKVTWLIQILSQYVGKAQSSEVIEEFLAEILDNEFSTIIEDGSVAMVSQLLHEAWMYHNRGDQDAVEHLIGQLEATYKSRPVACDQIHDSSSDSASDTEQPPCPTEEEEQPMEVDHVRRQEPEVDEDGWRVVRSRMSGRKRT